MPRRKHSQKRLTYLTEWERANIKQVKLAFNKERDNDIIEKLKEVPNNTEYVRKLIRADIEKEPSLKMTSSKKSHP